MPRRLQWVKKAITCDATNNTVPTTAPAVSLNGFIRGVKIQTPAAVDGAATVSVAITDPDGDSVYSKAGVAVNTKNLDYFDIKTNPSPLEQAVAGNHTITPTFSANQTIPRIVNVWVLLDSMI